MYRQRRKCCLVTTCENTSENSSKRFIYVPKKKDRRAAWFQAIQFAQIRSSKSACYICEDHFNLEEDADNWLKIRFFSSQNVVLKPGVVPHRLIPGKRQCEADKTNKPPLPEWSEQPCRELVQDGANLSLEADPLSLSEVETTNSVGNMPQNDTSWSQSADKYILPDCDILPRSENDSGNDQVGQIKSEITEQVWIKDDPGPSSPENAHWEEEMPARQSWMNDSFEHQPLEGNIKVELTEHLDPETIATTAETPVEKFWKSRAELLEAENKILTTQVMSMQATIDDLQKKLKARKSGKFRVSVFDIHKVPPVNLGKIGESDIPQTLRPQTLSK